MTDFKPEFKKIKLFGSGSYLYYKYMPWVRSVASGILVKAGTVDEILPKEAGLAHAVEHMVFQGTRRFGDSKSLSAYIENVGGFLNANTSYGTTFFYQVLPDAEFERSAVVLQELLDNQTFPADKIPAEMNNIIQEIKKSNDDHDVFLCHRFWEHLFGSHPFARMILGSEETVRAFRKDDFVNFVQRLYARNNMTFVVVGNVEEERAINILHDRFLFYNRITSTSIRASVSLPESIPKESIYFREVEQVHMCISYLPTVMSEEEINALNSFEVMIDGGMSFPLFQIVRDQKGLCYSIDAGLAEWDGSICNFVVDIGTDPAKYEEAQSIILDIIEKSKNDSELLEKARALRIGRLNLAGEKASESMNSVMADLRTGREPKTYQQKLDRINSVTIEDVKKAVEKYLTSEKMTRVLLKPKESHS